MKTILVTGAGAGIGRATAKLFHRQGWDVGITDVDAAALASLVAELGGVRVWSREVDVTRASDVRNAIKAFADEHGGYLRVLFNNAGILKTGRFERSSPGAHRQMIDVNVIGVINASHAAYRYLRVTPGAMVVNMSSASALHGTPDFATYSASKAAVRALTEALDIEWRDDHIRVCDLMPGFVDTAMVRDNSSHLIDRLGVSLVAEDVAEAVWHEVNRRVPSLHRSLGWQFRLARAASGLVPGRLWHEGMRMLGKRGDT